MSEPTIYALISDQGTACHETALCEKHYASPDGKAAAQRAARWAGDIPDVEDFQDCTGNDALECIICEPCLV